MKYFSVGTLLMLFNLVMTNDFSLTRTGGGTDLCETSCDLSEVKKQAISKALEDGKVKVVNECEDKRRGIVTGLKFPADSEVKCLSFDTEGGEMISCKAEVVGTCEVDPTFS